ncbi:MAG: type IV secretion system DNA-binding domain-containing protein [Patescibacteria group bacterium]
MGLDYLLKDLKTASSSLLYLYDKIKETVPFLDKIIIALIIFGIFLIILQNIQTACKYISRLINNFDTKVYRVTIPKTLKEEDPDKKKDVKSILSGFELFFYNMAGVEPEGSKGLKNKIRYLFKERSDHFSMEIINDSEDLISFYFSVPSILDTLLKQQITGVWPDAFIEEVGDYNIFDPNNESLAAEISLAKHYTFPIKTYSQFETDPLDMILNSISKFSKGDGVVIQIIGRSANASWRKLGSKVAELVNEGRSVNQAMSEAKANPIIKELMSWYYAGQGKDANDAYKFSPKKLSPAEEEVVKAIENKLNKPGMDINIRVIVSSNDKNKATLKRKLQNILDSFYQYGNYGLLNSFKYNIPNSKSAQNRLIKDVIYRNFKENTSYVLSSEELTTLFHLPLSTADIPNIRWLLARTAPATFRCNSAGLIIGNNTYRGVKNEIRLALEDRMRHMYIIGKSGTGKTNMMKDMAAQDAAAGYGFCIIDPHGDFAENVLSYIPKERAEDIIYFDPSDLERPIGLNLYEFDPKFPEQKTLVVNQFIEMLYTMYDKEQIGGPMFEYYTKNALLLNMEDPDSGNTMIEIPKVMAQDDFRHMKLSKCNDPIVKDFWVKEAEKAGGDASLANIVPYITSKLNQFIVNEYMRNIIGQQKSTINFADIMNKNKILICNFSKGKIGDMNSQLLGLIVTGRILISALQRATLPEKDRKPFFLYIDECQNFLTPAITTILAEARKYGLGLVLANQFITQLTKGNDTTIKDGIFGNAGTVCAYRISTEDAEFMEKIMSPIFTRFDLENSPNTIACCKTLINNSATEPFTLAARKYWEVHGQPSSPELLEKASYFKELSRLKYGRPKEIVNKEIMERLGFGDNTNSSENIEDELKRLFGE